MFFQLVQNKIVLQNDIDLLFRKNKKVFFPIARLDFLVKGALFIINNVEFCYKLSNPVFEYKKIYILKMKDNLKNNDLNTWSSVMYLDGENTIPCEIDLNKKDFITFLLKIIMIKGRNRNRQIKRIASLFGYKVIYLRKNDVANFLLGNLGEDELKLLDNNQFMDI